MNAVNCESKVFLKHEVKIGYDFFFPVTIYDYNGTLIEAHFTHDHIREAIENSRKYEKVCLYDK